MPRILLITSVLPWPLRRNGGAQRTALLRDALALHGEVDVLGIGDETIRESTPDFDRQLAQHQIAGCVVVKPTLPTSRWPGPIGGIDRVVQRYTSRYAPDPVASAKLDELVRGRGYDLIVSRYLAPACQADLWRFPAIPKILDFDDIDFTTLGDGIRAKPWRGIGGWIGSKAVLSRVERICIDRLKRFHHVFVTSDEDRKLLQVRERVSILPNIPFAEPGKEIQPLPAADASQELLFVGDLQFPPNRDGLDRFITRVWPLVRQRAPHAVLRVVGRGLADVDRTRWASVPGIEVVGFAPDLVDCYRRAAFTIVPVYYGGGTKIKVLESLAYGRTVVTTSNAMRGYASLRSRVRVADEDQAFADACVELLASPPTRWAMAERAQGELRMFSVERFRQVIQDSVSRLISR